MVLELKLNHNWRKLGITVSTVSNKLNYLITEKNQLNESRNAKELKIKIINQDEFIKC